MCPTLTEVKQPLSLNPCYNGMTIELAKYVVNSKLAGMS